MQVRAPGVGTPVRASNRPGMATPEPAPPATAHIQALAQRAARIQDLLQDMEVALLGTGDTEALRVLGGLKRAWRDFRDEALREGAAG